MKETENTLDIIEKVDPNETVQVQIIYKNEVYGLTRHFSDLVLKINGYPDLHLDAVSEAAKALMRKALTNSEKI